MIPISSRRTVVHREYPHAFHSLYRDHPQQEAVLAAGICAYRDPGAHAHNRDLALAYAVLSENGGVLGVFLEHLSHVVQENLIRFSRIFGHAAVTFDLISVFADIRGTRLVCLHVNDMRLYVRLSIRNAYIIKRLVNGHAALSDI